MSRSKIPNSLNAAGDHFIASSSIYGGTYNLFGVTMKKMGIECTFVDQDLPEEELEKLKDGREEKAAAESNSDAQEAQT